MIAVWVLTLAVVPQIAFGSFGPPDLLRVQLPRREDCEAVRSFLRSLDSTVPDALHVGECTQVLKQEGSSYVR